MPDATGKLTLTEQADLANLAMTINRAGPKARKALAVAIKTAHDDNPAIAASLKPYLDTMKDALADEKPAKVDEEEKPLTLKALREVLDEDEGKRRTLEAKSAREASRAKLVEDGRFTAESIKGFDEFVKQNGYEDMPVEHATILYAHEHPPTSRPTIGAAEKTWQLPKNKDLLANPRKAGLEKAYQVVEEMRRRA